MPRVPPFEQTTALVARALGVTVEQLSAGFRPARRSDLDQLLAIRSRILGGAKWDDAKYLAWRYHLGDASNGRGDCWVATRGDTVIGILGTERISVLVSGATVEGMTVMDIAVPRAFEGIGVGPWMAMSLCRRVDCVVAIGSNPNSRSIVSRIFTRLPNRRGYNYYVKFERPLRRRLKSPWAGVLLAPIAEQAMSMWRWVAIPGHGHLALKPIERFDAAVDGLIARTRDAAEVALGHTAESLNWRLFSNPRVTYTVWGSYNAERLIGYMAVYEVALPEGTKQLVIEDWLTDRDKDGDIAFRALLGGAIEYAQERGCDNVAVTACHEPSERVIRQLGFVPRANEWETLSVRSQHAGLSAAIEAGVPWRISGVDTDRES